MSDTTEPTARADAGLAAGRPQPAVVLAFCAGGARPPARRLLPPEGLVFGRDLTVFDGGPLGDARMSRRHATLSPSREEGRLLLRDLDSKNGTWVRGERVRQATLSAGDSFRLGDSVFVAGLGGPFEQDATLVGQGEAVSLVLRSIAAVAPHEYAVLIQGETGTGKEIAARAIHLRSGRRGPFVGVNCAGLSEGVLESELFGHVRGAFTGANASREGLFRAASGGTLLLDEVGELPLAVQAKLLRAVETGRVRPVGAARDEPADARIVAATNVDLAGCVRRSLFRADLYARLAQWTIAMPTLRERREDIPLLVRHFLDALGAKGRGVDVELGEALLVHPWPLNVRGLRNVLAAAIVAARGERAIPLSPEVKVALAAQGAIAGPDPEGGPAAIVAGANRLLAPSPEALAAALEAAGGSVAGAARALGASRQQLYRWAASLGVDIPRSRAR